MRRADDGLMVATVKVAMVVVCRLGCGFPRSMCDGLPGGGGVVGGMGACGGLGLPFCPVVGLCKLFHARCMLEERN